jgi:Spy/CpxP family protein refolding chaperone
MMGALAAPTIDRAKIEAMRAEHMKDMDAMSKRMTQAMTDAAEVLNPEQRQKLAQHMAERQQHRRPGAMGGGMGGMGR